MKEVKYKSWTFFVDIEATELAYTKEKQGGAESCGCNYCKNYILFRDDLYPHEIKALFKKLGIDYKKDTEVFQYAKRDDGLHEYGGLFHFKGSFTGKGCRIPISKTGFSLDLTPITDNLSIGFGAGNTLTFFEEKENLVEIDFSAQIPWVLDESLET